MGFSKSIPANGIRFYSNISFSKFENQVIQQQTVDENQLTYSKPINYDGVTQGSVYTNISFPIIKNKIKSSVGWNGSSSKSFAIVNNILNETKNTSSRPRISLDMTPNDNIGLYITGNLGTTKTNYNISTSQNQIIQRNDFSVEFNAKLLLGVYVASNYNLSFYNNERFGQSLTIPILNFSFYKHILKNKRGEIRLSAYDLFNKNVQFNQYAGSNLVSSSKTPSLARYFMATFTYNLRGMTAKVQKENW
jgi:hypothetical protein